MNDFSQFGKIFLTIGIVIAGIGLLMMIGGKIPWIGKLPGDLFFKGEKFTFYFPLTTSILASVILTLILWLISRK
ncbi:MAG: DUF2905 domain-containing protein [Syntrophales bacterium]|jgi:hypothetical protein|nr:DUF2905 domain-containing protein [Syntrophales bacterium]